MAERYDAVVVGSGPNGLAAAITLARSERSVLVLEAASTLGGGLRSDELAPGLVRDRCAAVLPFAIGSPFLSSLPLEAHGAQWIHPDTCFTHPLDDGRVGAVCRDLESTVRELGNDGRAYRRLVEPLARRWPELAIDVMAPLAHMPHHPLTMARFGRAGLRSARALSRFFAGDEARGILAGTASHAVLPLKKMTTAGFALLFCSSAHAAGWPVVRGGSQRLADALVSIGRAHGCEFRTERPVESMAHLPDHRVALFDVATPALARIAADVLPRRYRRRLEDFRHGPGVCKVDHVLSEPVPWADARSSEAGTVHVGGTFDEIMAAEADVAAGRHPERPFVIVAQQSVLDPTRSVGGRHVLWSYCHVPQGSDVDMSGAIEAQIERFAPGFRDTIVDRAVTTGIDLSRYNPNYVGGDIAGGANNLGQLLRRPTLFTPYRTPNPHVFLCSASTPPGGGTHGMSGHNAAVVALASRALR